MFRIHAVLHWVTRSAGTDRGAVAVEAALVIPLLLVMVFGILDTGLYLRDVSAVTAATRHGVRIASAEPRRVSMVDDVAQAVAAASTVLAADSIDELWVYQAGNDGFPVGTTSFSACPSRCVRLTWSRATGAFVPVSGTQWSPLSINACVGDTHAMSVGVLLRVRHRMLFSSVLGSSAIRTITDRTVMKFEPLPLRSCGLGLS